MGPNTITREELTAYHEAGHVVVAMELGVDVTEARIHGERGGEVSWELYPDIDSWMAASLRCQISLAGPAAETVASKKRNGSVMDGDADEWCGWVRDFVEQKELSESLFPGDAAAVEQFQLNHIKGALTIVLLRWERIERVAAALLKRRKLNERQLRAAVYGKGCRA